MDIAVKQLLSLLRVDEPITAVHLARALGVSERTVRTRLGELSGELTRNGGRLVARRRVGYQLEITDQNAFDAWRSSADLVSDTLPSTSDDRVRFILSYLLNHDDYIKLDDLSEQLFVSRNTVTADLKRVEAILEKNRLYISRRPNYGIRLEGEEFDRRCCIAQNFFQSEPKAEDPDPRGVLLSHILSTVTRECHLQTTYSSFRMMVIHLHVAIERQRQGHRLHCTAEVRRELRQSLGPGAISAAERLSGKLEEHMGVCCDDDEITYLAIHLSGKAPLAGAGRTESNQILTLRMKELITQMLDVVYEGNRLDFRSNEELKASLLQHMIPLDTRIRFDIPLNNPILDHIRTEYSLAFMVASTACTVLQKHYAKSIPQGEVGYIAILFGLAIEKGEKAVRKKNIVVVCASGRGTSQMLLYRCRQAFEKHIGHIYESTVFDLPEFDFEGLEIDCVLTTLALPQVTVLPVPVFKVTPFLKDDEVEKIRKMIERGDDDYLSNYFDARLFLPGLDADSKEDALKKMCGHASQFKTLGDDFYPLVLKREEMGQTDFGNLVAIPHTYRIVSPDRFVMTAILDRPIWWGHNQVQIVFLISLPESSDETVERFYRAMLNFQTDRALVDRVIEKRTYSELIKAFQEVGKR